MTDISIQLRIANAALSLIMIAFFLTIGFWAIPLLSLLFKDDQTFIEHYKSYFELLGYSACIALFLEKSIQQKTTL